MVGDVVGDRRLVHVWTGGIMHGIRPSKFPLPILQGIGHIVGVRLEFDELAKLGLRLVQLLPIVCQFKISEYELVHVPVGDGMVACPHQIPVAAPRLMNDGEPAQGIPEVHVRLLISAQKGPQIRVKF